MERPDIGEQCYILPKDDCFKLSEDENKKLEVRGSCAYESSYVDPSFLGTFTEGDDWRECKGDGDLNEQLDCLTIGTCTCVDQDEEGNCYLAYLVTKKATILEVWEWIVIGISFIVLIVIVVVGFLWWKKRQERERKRQEVDQKKRLQMMVQKSKSTHTVKSMGPDMSGMHDDGPDGGGFDEASIGNVNDKIYGKQRYTNYDDDTGYAGYDDYDMQGGAGGGGKGRDPYDDGYGYNGYNGYDDEYPMPVGPDRSTPNRKKKKWNFNGKTKNLSIYIINDTKKLRNSSSRYGCS